MRYVAVVRILVFFLAVVVIPPAPVLAAEPYVRGPRDGFGLHRRPDRAAPRSATGRGMGWRYHSNLRADGPPRIVFGVLAARGAAFELPPALYRRGGGPGALSPDAAVPRGPWRETAAPST